MSVCSYASSAAATRWPMYVITTYITCLISTRILFNSPSMAHQAFSTMDILIGCMKVLTGIIFKFSKGLHLTPTSWSSTELQFLPSNSLVTCKQTNYIYRETDIVLSDDGAARIIIINVVLYQRPGLCIRPINVPIWGCSGTEARQVLRKLFSLVLTTEMHILDSQGSGQSHGHPHCVLFATLFGCLFSLFYEPLLYDSYTNLLSNGLLMDMLTKYYYFYTDICVYLH